MSIKSYNAGAKKQLLQLKMMSCSSGKFLIAQNYVVIPKIRWSLNVANDSLSLSLLLRTQLEHLISRTEHFNFQSSKSEAKKN